MSEISKARERMFNKKNQQSESNISSEYQKKEYPRKFTLSSLTHQVEYKALIDDISPVNHLAHTNTGFINRKEKGVHSPNQRKTERGHISMAKENTPFKKINIKIMEINRPQDNNSNFNLESSVHQFKETFQYRESPPKVIHRQLLHMGKIELILAPAQPRRHHSPYKPSQCMIQWVEQFVGKQKLSGKNFVDDFFPPSRTIIFNKKILYQQQGLKFERLSRIYHNEIVIANCFEPTYLSLGKYTNPYLYSALTILAEDPSRILGIFGNQQANENGIYHINLCKDGVWRYVIIDDFVPVKIYEGRKYLLFVHSREMEKTIQIWPSLIQKAIAKIYGTYFDLSMIRNEGMSDLFRILTGAPISQYQITKDFRSYLILIDSALKRKHIVTLEMIPQEYQQTAELRKLNLYQAYKVLQIKKSGLKLRNYLQPDLVTKLAFEQCMIFSRLVIYRLETNYRYITHKLRHKKKFFSKLKVIITNKTKGYFEIWQNNPAYYKKHLGSQIEYELSKVKIWIGREDEEGDVIQRGKQVELSEGTYELHVHLCQQKQYDFTLSYYGQKQISIERIKNMEEWYEECPCNINNKKK